MRAARVHAFGEGLRIDDVDEPVPGEGEVLFEATLIGVNPLDVWVTEGTAAGGQQRLPFVPGSEATGAVPDRAVMVRGGGLGVTRDGLYQERSAVPLDAVVDVPDEVPLDQAAGLGVAGTTAWCLVHDVGRLGAQDRVLVLGASGGVGSLAVQLAKASGATVLGQTSDGEKAGYIQGLGADEVVVADADGLTEATKAFAPTVALDPLGDGYTGAAVAAMAPFGRLILFGTSAGPVAERFELRTLYRKSIDLLTYSGTIERQERLQEGLSRALDAVARGELKVPIDEVLPLERAQEAHDRIRQHRVCGKLLLRP
jgi:NADPH2:quinone reductase